jgi:hypothetical protein
VNECSEIAGSPESKLLFYFSGCKFLLDISVNLFPPSSSYPGVMLYLVSQVSNFSLWAIFIDQYFFRLLSAYKIKSVLS